MKNGANIALNGVDDQLETQIDDEGYEFEII